MKKYLALLLTTILCLSLCTITSADFSGAYLMGTGSATGNYYNFGSAMCSVVNQVTGANITVNATGGSIENARLLGALENEFALIQSDVYSYAHAGVELFEETRENFQAVTACYPEMVQIVVCMTAASTLLQT